MQDVVIVAATRTAIGRFQGGLADVPATKLGEAVVRRLLADTGVEPGAVSEVILGQVLTAGAGQNTARQTSIFAGLPDEVPAMTINKVCGSGLKAVHLGSQAIRCGEADVIIAGGQESMSLAPYVLPKARTGLRMGHASLVDSMIQDGLWDAFNDFHMGITAENLAEKYSLSREAQDAFAAASHRKAAAAINEGRFKNEITPVEVPQRKGDPIVFDRDEHPRPGTTIDALTKLRPINGPDLTVTAGNASGVNDGAAAMLMASEAAASQHGLTPIARVGGISAAGVEPRVMGIGPVPASQKVLARAGLTIDQMDVIELNEAFASQGIATLRALGVADDAPHVNANGGAIAIGHPLGMSGARLVMTAALQLKRTGGRYALCTMCVGVGQGVAIILERA